MDNLIIILLYIDQSHPQPTARISPSGNAFGNCRVYYNNNNNNNILLLRQQTDKLMSERLFESIKRGLEYK